MNKDIWIVKAIERQIDMLDEDPEKDIKLIDNLDDEINNWVKVVQRNKKKGIVLNNDYNIIKRRLYSKFVLKSKSQKLSNIALNWMGNFVENGPYPDLKNYVNNHHWVSQYREMKDKR